MALLYNERDLLQGVARGDQKAFRVIFHQHYKALCYFASSIILDGQEAEDLVQETFSKLWNKRADFSSATSIKAFLYIATKNACLNFIKQRERQSSREKEFSYLLKEPLAGDFDPILTETEIISELYTEIEQLPKQCQRVFKMSYLQGMKNEEIAAALHISYNTVRTQKLRALKLIRSSLLKKNLLTAFYAYIAFIKLHT